MGRNFKEYSPAIIDALAVIARAVNESGYFIDYIETEIGEDSAAWRFMVYRLPKKGAVQIMVEFSPANRKHTLFNFYLSISGPGYKGDTIFLHEENKPLDLDNRMSVEDAVKLIPEKIQRILGYLRFRFSAIGTG